MIVSTLLFLGLCSITPQEAYEASIKESKLEAKDICNRIEKELKENFDGKEYKTYTAPSKRWTLYFIKEYFKYNWYIDFKEDYKSYYNRPYIISLRPRKQIVKE